MEGRSAQRLESSRLPQLESLLLQKLYPGLEATIASFKNSDIRPVLVEVIAKELYLSEKINYEREGRYIGGAIKNAIKNLTPIIPVFTHLLARYFSPSDLLTEKQVRPSSSPHLSAISLETLQAIYRDGERLCGEYLSYDKEHSLEESYSGFHLQSWQTDILLKLEKLLCSSFIKGSHLDQHFAHLSAERKKMEVTLDQVDVLNAKMTIVPHKSANWASFFEQRNKKLEEYQKIVENENLSLENFIRF